MSDLSNPHDRFFKEIFSRPELAEEFLRRYLPHDVWELMAPGSLEIRKDSFVDKALKEHHSDMLYELRLRDSRTGYAYLLFEHKSYAEPLVGLDLLRYMARIWEQWLKAGNKPPLPPIVPVLVYHGRKSWSVATDFAALVAAPPGLEAFVPRFRYNLIDLSVIPDDRIQGQVMLRTGLLALKYIFDDTLRARLPDILGLLGELAKKRTGLEYLEALLRYLSQGTDRIDEADLSQAMAQVLTGGDELMPTIAETWVERGLQQGLQQGLEQGLEKGLEKGLQQGLQQGRLAAERQLLQRLAGRRFGDEVARQSELLLAKISNSEVLEGLGERLLDCGDGEEWLREIGE